MELTPSSLRHTLVAELRNNCCYAACRCGNQRVTHRAQVLDAAKKEADDGRSTL